MKGNRTVTCLSHLVRIHLLQNGVQLARLKHVLVGQSVAQLLDSDGAAITGFRVFTVVQGRWGRQEGKETDERLVNGGERSCAK